jgi:cytochrome c biogenesis protein CcmG, thiol:disulfide interchange protein DsbE
VRARLIPVSLAGAALIALLIYGLSAHSSNRTLDELVAKGEQPAVPQATRRLPILQGHGAYSVSAYRGKVVLMNIWASWCIPCQQEAPELQRTQRTLASYNATVLGVTYEDAAPDSIKFIHSNHLSYPDLRDDDGEFARAFGTDEVPESFLINRSGRIVAIERNELRSAFLTKAIKLAEGTPQAG